MKEQEYPLKIHFYSGYTGDLFRGGGEEEYSIRFKDDIRRTEVMEDAFSSVEDILGDGAKGSFVEVVMTVKRGLAVDPGLKSRIEKLVDGHNEKVFGADLYELETLGGLECK